MRSVDEIGNELYALPPAAFTSARDTAVAQARQRGDQEGARTLAALKRPTQGAHLVNLLALRQPDVIDELIALGEAIRSAQGTVSAADLRDLTTRRRAAVGTALAACRSLATEESGEPTAAQLAEAESTLGAAMADPDAAELVRSGRVVKALSYAGFGAGFGTTAPLRAPTGGQAVREPKPVRSGAQAGRPGTKAVRAEPEAPAGPEPESADVARQRRVAEQAAWERLAQAEADLNAAQAEERTANEDMDRIADEITQLRADLDAAGRRVRTARGARQAAERAASLARREVAALSTEERGR